ncbi:hypothetical protein ACVJBD_000500 [Rhizobium mongolense]
MNACPTILALSKSPSPSAIPTARAQRATAGSTRFTQPGERAELMPRKNTRLTGLSAKLPFNSGVAKLCISQLDMQEMHDDQLHGFHQ